MSNPSLRDFINNFDNENIHHLLFELKNNKDAFKMIYDQLREDEIPDLSQEKNEYVISSYFSIFSKYNDEVFNKYFFNSLYQNPLLNINLLRKEQHERPDNLKLKIFIDKIDKPKNIDKIVDKLFDYYSFSKELFWEYAKEESEKIKKINTIKAKNSRAVSLVFALFKMAQLENGTKEAFHIMSALNIDLFKLSKNTENSISLKDLKDENFLILKDVCGDNNLLYDFIINITKFDNIYKIINDSKIDNNNLLELWPSFIETTLNEIKRREKYIKNYFKSAYNIESISDNEPLELIFTLLRNEKARESIFKIYGKNENIEDFINTLKKINLDAVLPFKEKATVFKI